MSSEAFLQLEEQDGARFSWNVWPDTRLEATRMSVPIGCVYQPMKPIVNMCNVPYPPIRCKSQACGAVLNPYARVDFLNKIWVCPFCLTRNHFPHQYADISPETLPSELMRNSTTMQYQLDEIQCAPVFVFVIDLCIGEEELKTIKERLLYCVSLLPMNSSVALITFGKNVHVYELSFEHCVKAFVFNGSKMIDTAKVSQLLGLQHGGQNLTPEQIAAQVTRFVMPVSHQDFQFQFQSVLEDLQPDEWETPSGKRPERCTGTAMAVAIGLLEATYKGYSGRIMMFVGGTPTIGPGAVASIELKEQIRSHHGLAKGDAPLFHQACEYYGRLANTALHNGHAIDIFACSLDQVGVAEMRACPERTGGCVVLDESFTGDIFVGSFNSMFQPDENGCLRMAFGAQLQVLTSREFKVSGAIGSITSLDQKTTCVSENEVGIGGTCAWAFGAITCDSSVGIYFDIVNQNVDDLKDGRLAYVQIVTQYRTALGYGVMRVTTVAKTFSELKTENGLNQIRAGFDQEAAAVLITRLATYKADNEYAFDILRWLDRSLIRLSSKFASFQKDQPNTFRLPPEFGYYPQFMFNLRRSQFLQVFNSSPDETAFFRLVLQRENVQQSLIMIQPTLLSYSMNGPPQPVLLDARSVNPETILLLDTFFNVVLFHGASIAHWKRENVHLNEDYAHFAELLAASRADAESLMHTRFPYPRFVDCEENDSQSRFIMAKLNPSVTQNTVDQYGGQGQTMVLTDDVSLDVFMEHLAKLAVQQN